MNWIYLLLAGIFEVGFTTSIKLSEDFTNVKGVVGFLVFAALSFSLLVKSTQSINLGVAYAIWTGIGVVGTVAVNHFYFKEPTSFLSVLFIGLILLGVIGIKLTS